MSNSAISRLFSLLHQIDGRLTALLSGASYRLRDISEE
jgi:hypothetical protein